MFQILLAYALLKVCAHLSNVLYYSFNNCVLAGVKWVIRADKDRKIKFCCVQSNAAEPYLRASGLQREDVLRRFLFIEGLNVFSQGSTG